MKPVDILTTDIQFPPTVYIVGSGPSSTRGVKLIPPGAFIIAVNRAIELTTHAAIWMCHDPNLDKLDWFNNKLSEISSTTRKLNIAEIKAGGPVVPVFAESFAREYPRIRVTFKTDTDLHRPLDKSDGTIPIRATVAGSAMILAYYLGAKQIITVGVDMQGGYFNGDSKPGIGREDAWKEKPDYDWLVGYLTEQRGIKVARIEDVPPPVKSIEKTEPQTIKVTTKSRWIRIVFDEAGTWIVEEEKPVRSGLTNQRGDAKSALPSDLPSIGYLCMTVDPVDRMNAVFDFAQQDWPTEKKTLYLLTQRDSHGQFPGPVVNNMGLDIIQIDCDGYPWPELWSFKLNEALNQWTPDYLIWWDEDDRYPHDYTRACMAPILAGQGELSWSWDCIIVEYDLLTATYQYRDDWYRSPIGQLCIKTPLLKEFWEGLWRIIYEPGPMDSPKRRRGVPYGGAQDDQLRQVMQRNINPIPHHRGKRAYFVHSQANSAQLRAYGNSIDYQGERGTVEERTVQKTRFDFDRSKDVIK